MAERTQTLQEKVDDWGAEARRLVEAGREVSALDLYRKAADAMPGAPWLQQRTGELSRKLRQNELAVGYFLRAADAFINAGFAKRAIPALRSAWTVARQNMPRSSGQFMRITQKLARLQKELGLSTDASVTIEYANDTLRRLGLPELNEARVLSGEPLPDEAQGAAS